VLDPQLAAFAAAIADRWAIDAEIGRGSRGTVYRARDVANGGNVAIKVFRSDLASAIDGARFLAQMRATAGIRHENIVPILEVNDVAGRLFVVMPFIDGESLRVRLRRERRLALSDAVAIARQVADALGHAHAQGALHKDVKPENIVLEGSRALLMDLGVARAISRSIDETMTGSGLALGTPVYMSPEHARGGVEIDGRADLYSLGCVLYEMLAGEPPFTGDRAVVVLKKALTETPVRIATIRDAVPPDIDGALDRLLAKTPAARYPDAAHLVDALSSLESLISTERA
jgi:eukaryotic-like serine/threonine-protein kinase